jgi:hypothetical protein
LAHAPERLHDEITADYNYMIYAATREEIEVRRKAFIRKWRLKPSPTAWRRPANACSPSPGCRQANGAAGGPTNAIEWLHEEFKLTIDDVAILVLANRPRTQSDRTRAAALSGHAVDSVKLAPPMSLASQIGRGTKSPIAKARV